MGEFRLVSRHRPAQADVPAEGKRRIRLTVEFDGTAYCGWQRQLNGPSIQQTLEEALCALTGEHAAVIGSSRTDAGVHARGLCAHFDTASRIPAEKFSFALNSRLPWDIRVRESCLAPPGFHARYAACGKVYRYRFCNERQMKAIGRQYAAHWPLPLSLPAMQEEAALLVGRHDFAAFAASGSVAKDTVRTLYAAEVTRDGGDICLTLLGDGFLYNMVRIAAGTLAEVGCGKRAPGAVARAIETGDRLCLGATAPPQGLTLEAALYEGDEALALSFFRRPPEMPDGSNA